MIGSAVGEPVTLAPPEYVIIRKLQFFREGGAQKHLRDINRMLAALGDDWENSTLMALIDSHGLQSQWRQAVDFGE